MRRLLVVFVVVSVLSAPCSANIWSDISNGISDAANAVGNAVDTARNATENAVGTAVNATRNGVGDAVDTVGSALGTAANATQDFVSGAASTVSSGINTAIGVVGGEVSSIADYFTGNDVTPLVPSIKYGPIITKAMVGLQYATKYNASQFRDESMELDLSDGGSVTIRHPGLNQIVVVFTGGDLNSLTKAELNETDTVPYLDGWLDKAQAPSALLDVFMELIDGTGSGSVNGTLVDAINELAGNEPVLHVIVTGEGAGGGLAAVAAPALALAYPLANVDVQTFGLPWTGFNPQFSWAFDQLTTLYYIWPFNSTDIAALAANTSSSLAPVDRVAIALNTTIGPLTIGNATLLPNLPPSVPAGYEAGVGVALGVLAPVPGASPAPSACPPILCKSREPARAACLLWRPSNATVFEGLPRAYLHSNLAADAVVAYDNATGTAYIAYEGTDTRPDWLADLLVFKSDDFRPPGTEMFEGVGVHHGFLNQFESLTDGAQSNDTNITAVVLNMTGGRVPRRVVASGHSLGSALASLTGVWASSLWPNASVTVVGTGTPKVGNAAWVREFRAVVGRAYRFVYEVDQVPSLPPIDSYHQLPNGVWFRDALALAVNRPPIPLAQTTWDDHNCETLYVPALYNATGLEVPAFVADVTPADASLPSYALAEAPEAEGPAEEEASR